MSGKLLGADQLGEHVDPVGDDLAVAQGVAQARSRFPRPARGLPLRSLASSLGSGPVAGAGGYGDKRLADLAGREAIVARTRLSLPRLQAGRALHAIGMRLALAGENRGEPMTRLAVGRPTQPALTAMRRFAVPAGSHDR